MNKIDVIDLFEVGETVYSVNEHDSGYYTITASKDWKDWKNVERYGSKIIWSAITMKQIVNEIRSAA